MGRAMIFETVERERSPWSGEAERAASRARSKPSPGVPLAVTLPHVGAIEDRLTELGLELPAPLAAPTGVSLPFELVRLHGGLGHVSRKGARRRGRPLVPGRAGARASAA